MRLRASVLIAAAAGLLLLALCVSYTPGKRMLLVDEAGRPLGGAYVFCSWSSPPKTLFTHFEARLFRSDAGGRLATPTRWHFRNPLARFIAPVALQLAFYAPALHNCCFLHEDDGRFSYEADRIEMLKETPEPVILLKDCSDPERRYRSLWLLVYAFPLEHVDAPLDQKRDLLAQMEKEYEAFVREYGDTLRDYSHKPVEHAPEDDWIQWDGAPKPWRFFLGIPWYGEPMEKKLEQMESQLH
jgi:hypothetical protein